MKNKIFSRGRKWLNPVTHVDTGAVTWKTEVSGEKWADAQGWIQIRDCDRQIVLEFDVCDQADVVDRTRKLNILIKALTEIREDLPVMLKAAQTRRAEFKEKD